MDAENLANRIVDILAEGQAEDVALIDVSRVSSVTDYFVIASLTSPLQFRALTNRIERELKAEDEEMRARNGTAESGWLLLDYTDVIVHLFSPEKRALYRLEELWGKTSPVVRFTG